SRSKEEFFHRRSPFQFDQVRKAAALNFPRQQLEPRIVALGKRPMRTCSESSPVVGKSCDLFATIAGKSAARGTWVGHQTSFCIVPPAMPPRRLAILPPHQFGQGVA